MKKHRKIGLCFQVQKHESKIKNINLKNSEDEDKYIQIRERKKKKMTKFSYCSIW